MVWDSGCKPIFDCTIDIKVGNGSMNLISHVSNPLTLISIIAQDTFVISTQRRRKEFKSGGGGGGANFDHTRRK